MPHLEVIHTRPGTRWQRFKQTVGRSFTLGPYSLKNPPRDGELARIFGGNSVAAGVHVDEDAAFATSAFFSAVVMIAWDLASLPLVLFRRLEEGGKTRYTNHPLYRLLHDRPNPEQTSFEFRAALLINALALGNGYAEIERDGGGRPVALWLLETHRVSYRHVNGQLLYEYVQPNSGKIEPFEARDIIHIKGPSLDGATGFNTVRIARQALGMAIAAERFGANYFANGTQLGGVLSTGLTGQALENLRSAMKARHQGVDRAHGWLLADASSKFTEVGTSPKDSQLTELREHQVREIARFLRVPVVMIGDLSRATWGNYGEAKSQYFDSCLRTWCANVEQQLTSKLVSSLERAQQFVEHVTEGFLKADAGQRATFYGAMLDRGVFCINEVRALENLPPVPGGDTPRVPLNFEPLTEASAEPDEEDDDPPPPPADDGKKDAEIEKLRAEVAQFQEQVALARHTASLAEQVRDARQADVYRLEVDVRSGEEACAALTRKLAEVQQVVVEMVASEQALIIERDTAAAERDAAMATIETVRQELATSNEALEQATRCRREADEARAQAEQERDSARSERDTALALAEEAQTARNAAEATITAANEAQKAAETSALEAVARADEALARFGKALDHLESLALEWDDFRRDVEHTKARLAAADTSEREAQTQAAAAVSAAERERDEARQQADVTVAGLRAELEHMRADLTAARQESAGAALALDVERQQRQADRAAALASMRPLLADATNRLLTKEALSARKHQTTAEKLRVWVDSFYPLHEDLVRSVFLPLVSPWTVLAGGDARDLLDALVRQHVAESERAMRQVLEVEDEDERAATLERTLRRWEDERANVMADALVREGMGR